MEPVPPTIEALEKLDRLGQTRVEQGLRRISDQVVAVVPACVGLSLTLVGDAVTLTFVASDLEALSLDAMQYLDGGPCVESVGTNEVIQADASDPLDEGRWSMFARASAAHGVKGSLSLPILDHERVVGGVNLYASVPGAFRGHVDEVARIVGAWAPGAVQDADLSFDTRAQAMQAPVVLADQADVDVACGIIAAEQNVEIATARERLRGAAARAGLRMADVARTVITIRLG
jgi:GAF domain-containing protein